MDRNKKKRAASRNVVKGLLVKTAVAIDEENRMNEVQRMIMTIETKMASINELNEEILGEIEDEKFQEEIEESTKFEIDVMKEVDKYKLVIEEKKTPVDVEPRKRESLDESMTDIAEKAISDTLAKFLPKEMSQGSQGGSKVKLPKISIKEFDGDPLRWQQFDDIFEATVVKSSISNIEKFSHLHGYLKGDAAKCIEGIPIIGENFETALGLLRERFGNPQLAISNHMEKLLNLEGIESQKAPVKEVRRLYDKIESHLRSLLSLGVKTEHFGPMLMPVIVEKLPDDIKLEISRRLGNENWKIDDFMEILKTEITARENCSYVQTRTSATNRKGGWNESKDKKLTTQALHVSTNRTLKCCFCKQAHYADKCQTVTDIEARRKIVYDRRLCWKCLSPNHSRKDCRYRKNCYSCKSIEHHTAVCDGGGQEDSKKEEKKKEEEKQVENIEVIPQRSTVAHVNVRHSVLLQTVNTEVFDVMEKCCTMVKILLDVCSQRTYVTQRLVDALKLEPIGEEALWINTFGDAPPQTKLVKEYRFVLRSEAGANLYLKGFAVPKICSRLSGQEVEIGSDNFPELKDAIMSNNMNNDTKNVEILIGADFYWTLIGNEIRRSQNDALVAIKSKFGWIMSGPIEKTTTHGTDTFLTHVMKIDAEIDETREMSQNVEKFWDLDSVGVRESEEEKSVFDKFKDEVRLVDGMYEVRLPFKEGHPLLHDNFQFCVDNVKKLTKSLHKTPKVLIEYDKIIGEQRDTEMIEEAKDPFEAGEGTYSTHRAVIRPDKLTSWLRIILNHSLKIRGPSLNDCLYKGPCLTPLLFDVFLRFRVHKIALVADIRQAFLQISIAPEHRNFLRFLWWDDVFSDEPKLKKYRFCRVTFGGTSSPFLLNAVIRVHIEKYEESYPEIVDKLSRSLYVDDLNAGVNDTNEGYKMYQHCMEIFGSANFDLRKWRTNDPDLRQIIGDKTVEDSKVLGIRWDEIEDVLKIDVKNFVKDEELPVTKRNVLKVVVSFYDPIGYIQPIVIQLKIFFQEICKKNFRWDDVLDEELIKRWKKILKNVMELKEIRIPRCYCYPRADDPFKEVHLVGFSDASPLAYGACVYLRYITESGRVTVNLVSSKSRVAPLKKEVSLPRLELLGNLLLGRLMTSVINALDKDIQISKILCFTDSQISLAWIKNSDKDLKQFVQNRVAEIRKNVPLEDWYYCKSADNPADLITRIKFSAIDEDMWWHGPPFLKNIHDDFEMIACQKRAVESMHDIIECVDYKKELKGLSCILTASENTMVSDEKPSLDNIIDINRYSDFLKLLRVTAYVLRFVGNMRKKIMSIELIMKTYVTKEEMSLAKMLWVRANQMTLRRESKYKQLEVQLNLKSDAEGIIRTHSRMKNSCQPDQTKFAIMLSKVHRLATLVVLYCHLRVLHRKVKQTLTEFRVTFWTTQGRSFVKKILRACTVCKKLNARALKYPGHSDLPVERFIENRPFAATGVDYLGPLYCLPVFVKADKTFKAYIVLYTCISTRALILDVVHAANAKVFIDSLRRFIARRGAPSLILSDNGKSFIADETQSFVANKFIQWKFNLALAPWQGGIWERLVSCVKRCIKKTVGVHVLDYVELQTLVLEVESVLNNRPLCQDYDDDLDDVLTPNHLLFGRRIENTNLDCDEEIEPMDQKGCLKANKKMLRMKDYFWGVWRKEYLTMLREVQKITRNKTESRLDVGDIVIVYDKHQPRHLWKLARVTSLKRGKDDVVRGATIKFAKSGMESTRPLNMLYPLELRGVREKETKMDPSKDSEFLAAEETTTGTVQKVSQDIDANGAPNLPNERPKRRAFIDGEAKRRTLERK